MRGSPLWGSIRRDRIAIEKVAPGAKPAVGLNAVVGEVHTLENQGSYVKVTLDLADSEEFVAHVLDETFFARPLDIGERVVARWSASDVKLLDDGPIAEEAASAGYGDGDGRLTWKPPTRSARELYEIVKADRSRRRFGFGRKPALVNVDLQNAYTRPDEFPTAYETDPRQIEHVNALARPVPRQGLPGDLDLCRLPGHRARIAASGAPAATRPNSLQNIKEGSRRAGLDERCEIERGDIVINKRMASAFFETNLGSLFTWHKVDTVIVTGGSTSGCVRATVVDSLSRGFRTVVPEECVADRHESPHFANLYDMALKYADVLPVAEVAGASWSNTSRQSMPDRGLQARHSVMSGAGGPRSGKN